MKQLATFVTIPFAMAVPPVLGWFFGKWIDEKLGSAPFCMYFLIVAGFLAGFREVYRIVRRYGDES